MNNTPWRRQRAAVWLAASLVSGAVGAQGTALVNAVADLRSGPDPNYPLVTVMEPGTTVAVMGCLPDFSWCDVARYDFRGWLYGGYLVFPYQGAYWPVLTYGGWAGYPTITFSIGTYWDNHYRAWPWYEQRERWYAPAPVPRVVTPRPDRYPDRPPPQPPQQPANRAPDTRLGLPVPPRSVQPATPPAAPPPQVAPQLRPDLGRSLEPQQPPRKPPGDRPDGKRREPWPEGQ